MPTILSYNNIRPEIPSDSFIGANSSIIGDVVVGNETGIWFNCVLRGDVAKIRVGNRTNIQDGTVIHVTRNGHPTIIGSGVTIGHNALLHACTLEDNCFIGMGAIIMDDAIIEEGAMVAAGALVPPGKRVKNGEIWAGNPAKYFRNLRKEEAEFIFTSADNYVAHVHEYLSHCS